LCQPPVACWCAALKARARVIRQQAEGTYPRGTENGRLPSLRQTWRVVVSQPDDVAGHKDLSEIAWFKLQAAS
jgi:hypothetical protein